MIEEWVMCFRRCSAVDQLLTMALSIAIGGSLFIGCTRDQGELRKELLKTIPKDQFRKSDSFDSSFRPALKAVYFPCGGHFLEVSNTLTTEVVCRDKSPHKVNTLIISGQGGKHLAEVTFENKSKAPDEYQPSYQVSFQEKAGKPYEQISAIIDFPQQQGIVYLGQNGRIADVVLGSQVLSTLQVWETQDPSLSSDGRKIGFVERHVGKFAIANHICVVELNGNHRIYDAPYADYLSDLKFSTDGKYVIYELLQPKELFGISDYDLYRIVQKID